MEDIYDESGMDDCANYVDGVVGGVMLGKFMSETDSSTYQDGVDANGEKIDYTDTWSKMAPPRKGISGVIATLVRINSVLIAIASIALLIYLGFVNGFNL